jgi:preprotein translocase subunit SecE
MADNKDTEKQAEVKELKPNIFMRIGLFIRQIIAELRKTVAPTRKQLLNWFIAVLIFVVLLMVVVTALDFGLGKLVFLVFG